MFAVNIIFFEFIFAFQSAPKKNVTDLCLEILRKLKATPSVSLFFLRKTFYNNEIRHEPSYDNSYDKRHGGVQHI